MTHAAAIRARWAVIIAYLAHGLIWGAWVPHIPLVNERLAVGPAVFGLALLAMAAGAVIAMPVTGALINRYGSATLVKVTGTAFCLLFMLPPLAPTLATYVAAALAFGATIGSMDVAINAHGIAVEKALHVPTMSAVHGGYSVGSMAGALLGAAALAVIGPASHVVIAAASALGLLVLSFPLLLPADVDRGLSASGFAWPTRATIGLGLLCFLALMIEGSVTDWSGIAMRIEHGVDPSTAALAFGAFATGMSVARLVGDRLRQRFGAVRLVATSAAIAALGIAAAVSLPSVVGAIGAFAVAGLGLGNVAPLLFAGGGRLEPAAPGRGIAAVTTLGYAGFLAGPPLIGFVAEMTSLAAAFWLMVGAGAAIAAAAAAVRAADTY